MSNFFFLNEAAEIKEFNDVIDNMHELCKICKKEKNQFFKHDSIWQSDFISEVYQQRGQKKVETIVLFIERELTTIENYISNEEQFDLLYPDEANGFLGIDFSPTSIASERQVINDSTYIDFLENFLWTKITFKNLWINRKELFPSLELCGEVESQISRVGNSSFFLQIIDRLRVLDKAVEEWTDGSFSYKYINDNYSIRISPESERTMDKFGNERLFSLPEGGTEFFELHIKTGELRFHFYPDNDTGVVYLGYIGPHLNTVSN